MTQAPQPRTFQITSPTGLRYDQPPLRLWEKAKRMGIWNPSDIDLSEDAIQWQQLADDEQDLLLRLASLFGAGEESVTLELLPLIQVIATEGRLEEEMFLTSFLWEEAKHVEAFRRFFDQVALATGDLSHYHSPSYRRIFYEELPSAMSALRTDASPRAQARASATYNLIVEGVLAETGYHVYFSILKEQGILPGMQRVVSLLKADESRHLAYGVFLLSRLVAEHGEVIWETIEERMNELLEPAIGVIQEAFEAYPPNSIPFNLELDPFIEYAMGQFQKRMDRVERARNQTLAEILREPEE